MLRFLLLFFLLSVQALAQTGTIRGTVTTSDGKPAEFVNIVLEKTARGAVVSEAGQYAIHKIPVGTYTITASFTGLIAQKSTVTVAAGETSSVDFTLAEDNRQLQEVVVRDESRLTNKETEYVARMPLKNLENPQVYNVVGKDLIKEQQMTDIKDVFRAAAGVAPTEYVTGSFAVVFRGFTNFDYARNGMATSVYRSPGLHPSFCR
jgi:iron complex outermembrane receptor protein